MVVCHQRRPLRHPAQSQTPQNKPPVAECTDPPPPLTPPADDPAPAHPAPYSQNPAPLPAPTPWLTGHAPAPWAWTADLLAQRIESRRKAATCKHWDITLRHTRAWYQQSANKEADERGSRASISVDGLRLDDTTPLTTELNQMVEITRSYFVDLHTPEPNPPERLAAKAALLEEVAQAYSSLPPPEDPASGPFTTGEIQAIRKQMPNTAPGPDGIQYSFWKALAARADDQDLVPFWDTLLALTNDLRAHGTDCCGFKDANISLFYKKGDPTLTKNYRPISSMNTDCKMWSNLINGRLAAWAVAKIHPDQKGFVPGWYITEQTRLAAEVAHLSDVKGTNSYIVSLDQAKAYDHTDLPWLIAVLTAMGICEDLITLVKDHTHHCRARVRINSGYSSPFPLLRGVRQGDPLSCLLYAFSLEPLGHRLRNKIHGISVLNLPPAKLMMYADDTNLFLSAAKDNLEEVAECLESTSYAIGCKFNLDKTDVLPVGSDAHKEANWANGVPLPGAYILVPGSPLRILGVWIGCQKQASPRWAQILTHTKKLIGQWNAIGTSVQNRVLIAKLLMQSQCYYLLDGNGIPPKTLTKLSNLINRFVCGRYSLLPYWMLAPPLSEGGLNFPSLKHRKEAYDLKFLGDLTQGDQTVPWKTWTYTDLRQASTARPSTKWPNRMRTPANCDVHRNLNPILQRTHTKYGDLEPRVRHAIMAARRARVNIKSCAPSARAQSSAPADYHHALSRTTVQSNLEVRGITTVGELVRPVLSGRRAAHFIHNEEIEYTPSEDENTDPFRTLPWDAPWLERLTRLKLLGNLLKTDWHPQLDF